MTWRIEWSPLAVRRLLEMPWRDAVRVDAAHLELCQNR